MVLVGTLCDLDEVQLTIGTSILISEYTYFCVFDTDYSNFSSISICYSRVVFRMFACVLGYRIPLDKGSMLCITMKNVVCQGIGCSSVSVKALSGNLCKIYNLPV